MLPQELKSLGTRALDFVLLSGFYEVQNNAFAVHASESSTKARNENLLL